MEKIDNAIIEEAYNHTFSGLTMYYRDCDLNPEWIARYKTDQILMERGYTDVSSFAEGLDKNLRYAIASNKAVYMGQINPDVAKFGFNLISAPSYYKVLDIYTIEDKTQVLLLHFDQKYMDVFNSVKSNIEEKVIGMGRESLDKKMLMQPNHDLNSQQWSERTSLPVGMSHNGIFFTDMENDPSTSGPQDGLAQTDPDHHNTTGRRDTAKSKNGFWKRLFGG